MIGRATPTNVLPHRSRLWRKPIQHKLCHLLFNQPYQERTLCIDLFPLRLTSPTYLPYLPTQRTLSETKNSFFNTYKRIITLWLIAIPLKIPDKHVCTLSLSHLGEKSMVSDKPSN